MSETIIDLPDENATAALGRALAGVIAAGDVIRLEGDLGAGKSTLARGLITGLTGAKDAPSPTFTLVETYETHDFVLWHFDLYRLEHSEEVWELGLEEALDGGAVLIEWPERIERMLPPDALTVRLEILKGARRAHIDGNAPWRGRLKTAGIA